MESMESDGNSLFMGVLIKNTIFDRNVDLYKNIKWVASYRWSFYPNSAWDSIEMTTIGKMHPILDSSVPESFSSNFEIIGSQGKPNMGIPYLVRRDHISHRSIFGQNWKSSNF